MMPLRKQAVVLILLAAAPSLCFADGLWGNASLGYLQTSGNSQSTSLNFKGALGYRNGPWSNLANAQATSASSNGASTARRYSLGDKLKYSFTPSNYLFGSVNYVNDAFAGIVQRYSEAVGYGRRIIDTKTQKLNMDVGVGANQQRFAGTTGFNNEPIGVFDADYLWNITPTSTFQQKLHVEAGPNNTLINPVTDLSFTIIGNLFATLSYEVNYNTSVPPGNKHADTITSVNIGYKFGKQP